jgi:hypothetical protein
MKKYLLIISAVLFSINSYSQNYIQDLNRINTIDIADYQQNICISSNKKYLAIATLNTIKIVDIQNFKIVKLLPVQFRHVKSLSFLTSDENILIVGNHKDSSAAEIYNWREKTLVKKLNPIEKGEMWSSVTSDIHGDYLVCIDRKSQVFVRNINTLDLIIKIPPAGKHALGHMPVISNDGSLIAVSGSNIVGFKATLYVYDVKGNLKYSQDFERLLSDISFNEQNELIVVSSKFQFSGDSSSDVIRIDVNTKKPTKIASITDVLSGHVMINNTGNFVIYEGNPTTPVGDKNWNLEILPLDDPKIEIIVSNDFYQDLKMRNDELKKYPCLEISKGKYLISSGYDNFNYIIDGKNREILGFLFHSGNGLAYVSSDGRFTGDNEAIENLQYKIKGSADIKLVSQVDQLFTPKLLFQMLNPDYIAGLNNADLNKMIKLAPELKIVSPDSISNQKANFVKVRYTVKDNGDGVKEVKFYVNGKLLNDDFRGVQAEGEKSRDILLITGENIIDAVAVSKSGYQSAPARIVAKYRGGETTTNLYMLGIGIDQYKNPRYNLNYAVTDAESLIGFINSGGTGIFSAIDAKVITNQLATKTNILAELNRISEKINETDVFILFYAGHGVMSEGSADVPKDYYLALTDIVQMYGNDQVLSEKGISAAELREWCKNIKAQKQVILLDACQSGGATEIFAMRGASEEKAIIQLAQSTGVFLISSAGAEQFATEYAVLKHGLFTYALLEGLGGKADGGSKDGKITIKEIEAYLNDLIPELSQKYKGSAQFPNTWSKGMDFPVVISKQ